MDHKEQIIQYVHDTIGHDLAYICLRLDHFLMSDLLQDTEKTRQEIENLRSIAYDAADHVHNMLSWLYDEDPRDLSSGLQETVNRIGEQAEFMIHYNTRGNPQTLPTFICNQVLYIAREALWNAKKHANAQEVLVDLNWEEEEVILQIADDGQGFDVDALPQQRGHYGLRIIQKLADEIHASLSIDSFVNSGTKITLSLPLINRV